MDEGFTFNSDLLHGEDERAAAKARYPAIYFALDNPELRDLFDPIDADANREKTRSRRWGVAAVVLVTLGLMAGAAPLQATGNELLEKIVAGVAAAAGAIGVAIALFGVTYGAAKERWLSRRYLTERIRQLHFQMLVAWGPDIVSAAQAQTTQAFLKERSGAILDFKAEQIARVAAKVSAVLSDQASEDGWLVEQRDAAGIARGEALDQLLDALMHLRLRHQIDFTDFKLRTDHKLFSSSPLRQAAVFSGAALLCVLGLLVLHFAVVSGVIADIAALHGPYIHVAAIWLALLALAIRTLEEGLQSPRETERYRQYNAALRLVRARFSATKDPVEKLAALRELEEVSYEEMITFLKSQHDANFVM